MNDQFPPPSWSLRPEHWMYRLPGTVFGRLPASWAPQLPPVRTSDTWDQSAPTGSSPDTPSRGGILGQFSQPIDLPPVDPWSQLSGRTGWNSPTSPSSPPHRRSLQHPRHGTGVGIETAHRGSVRPCRLAPMWASRQHLRSRPISHGPIPCRTR